MGVEKFVRQTQLQRVERNMQCDRKTIISLTLISYQEKVLISHSDQQKLWFRFRFYRNPKVLVSTETHYEQKPKPKPEF